MNEYPTPERLAQVYSRMLNVARCVAHGSLRRLQELHNRYPEDLPQAALAALLTLPDPTPTGVPGAAGAAHDPRSA